MGEDVTDWLGDTGVLLVSCCDVLVGTMVPKPVASVVTVSLLMEYVGERFVDDTIPIVEFGKKICGDARELDGETADADIA